MKMGYGLGVGHLGISNPSSLLMAGQINKPNLHADEIKTIAITILCATKSTCKINQSHVAYFSALFHNCQLCQLSMKTMNIPVPAFYSLIIYDYTTPPALSPGGFEDFA